MSDIQTDGFLALPSTNNGRAVLVLHAWWGLNDTIKTVCTRLAESGFVAFAPDLYHGKVTDTIEGAESLSSELFDDLDKPRAKVAKAVEFLVNQSDVTNTAIAVIGFSLGAFFALDLSVSDPDHIRSVVTFYGTRPGDYSRSKADYLLHFSEQDEFEPQSEVEKLEASLKRAERPVTAYQYKGTGHWFFEPDRTDAYQAESASLAWDRSLDFLLSSDN